MRFDQLKKLNDSICEKLRYTDHTKFFSSELYIKPNINIFKYDEGVKSLGYGYDYITLDKFDLARVFYFFRNEVELLDEYKSASEFLVNNYNQSESEANGKLQSYCNKLVENLVCADGKFSSDDFLITFIRDLDQSPIIWKIIASIEGIWLKEDILQFDEFTLRKPTIIDASKEYKAIHQEYEKSVNNLPMSYLEFQTRAINQREVTNEIHKILDILRLYKLGSVHCSRIEYYPHSVLITTTTSFSPKDTSSTYKYGMNSSDISKLNEFFHSKSSLIKLLSEFENPTEDNKLIFLTLKRYRNSILKNNTFEEKITTSVVCLESIFLKSSERSELTHRLSQRVSFLLGRVGYTPMLIYKKINKAYEIRSMYIHGSDVETKELDQNANLPREIIDYTRLCILIFLNLHKKYPKDNFLNKIDNAMLDDNASKALDKIIFNIEDISFVKKTINSN